MKFRQLEAYVKAYDLQSFSKAAEALYVSQPSISSYVSSLEKELGTQLIYRSTKEFMPTKSGELFYIYAREMLALRDTSTASLKDFYNPSVGSINILASSVPSQFLLPELLGAFHARYPQVVFSVQQADTVAVVQSIASSQGDLGFVGSRLDNPRCVFEKFFSESMVLIAPPRLSALQREEADAISRLVRTEHFVSREAGSGTRKEYEEYLATLGISPGELRISACFDNTQAVIHAVAHGLGLAIVSELAAKYYLQQGFVVSLPLAAPPQRDFYMVLKKDKPISAVVQVLLELVHSR